MRHGGQCVSESSSSHPPAPYWVTAPATGSATTASAPTMEGLSLNPTDTHTARGHRNVIVTAVSLMTQDIVSNPGMSSAVCDTPTTGGGA